MGGRKKVKARSAILATVRRLETRRRIERFLRRQLDDNRCIFRQPALLEAGKRRFRKPASIRRIEKDHIEGERGSPKAASIGPFHLNTARAAERLDIAFGQGRILIDKPDGLSAP